jgi:hypothetical protein
VARIERGREEAILPEMSAAAVMQVKLSRIEKMRTAQASSQSVGALRDDNQVHVISHQAIAEHTEAAAAAPFGEQLAVGTAVGIVEKDGLAVVPPLRDVVRYVHRNHARDAWHECFPA